MSLMWGWQKKVAHIRNDVNFNVIARFSSRRRAGYENGSLFWYSRRGFIICGNHKNAWGTRMERLESKIKKDELFNELSRERDESVNYCRAAYNVQGAVHDVVAGTTPVIIHFGPDYMEFMPK